VLGFARQGKALARWLPTIGVKTRVSDAKTAEQLNLDTAAYPDVEFYLGGDSPDLLDHADAVAVSGGVPLDHPVVQAAIQRGIPLTNDAQLFLERCPAQVIGITGSAGKTTTTTLTGEIVRRAGFRTFVGGNIGDVLLDVLPDIRIGDRVVMELSSFQLELMSASPDIAAVLNVTPNHLDRHGTMEAYTLAKANIFKFQHTDGLAVFGYDDPKAHELSADSVGDVVYFSGRDMVTDGAFLAGKRMILSGLASPDRQPYVLGDRDEIQLRGDHNVLNVLAACAITGAAGIKPDAMMPVIREFRGVPHRLEVVRTVRGVTFINDSIATAPERVLAALRSFHEPLILLLGGRDKKLPWDEMLTLAVRKSRHIIAFGEAGDLVMRGVQRADPHGRFASAQQVDSLEHALIAAQGAAQHGDIVLLSPGGTSYDAYLDFAERGEHFRALVNAL
jgi:UDP-N-acetylmuramoylalanine--D-glutamate ligase